MEATKGSQSIGRAITLLRLITDGPRKGLTLNELAEAAELHPATAHRQLAALIQEGLIEQDASYHYHPGVELWLMGQVAAQRFDIRDIAQPVMARIAEKTEDTVYLFIRSGMKAVCVHRCEGSFPIRTLTLNVGDRRPLGINAGALALLSFLNESDREEALTNLMPLLRSYPGYSVNSVRRAIEETRAQGFAFVNATIIPGMSAIGVPILDRHNQAVASLSVAAIEQRMSKQRRLDIVRLAQEEVRALSGRLALSGRTRPAGPQDQKDSANEQKPKSRARD